MSGRHRKPQPDALTDVDLAKRLEQGPVVDRPQETRPRERRPQATRPQETRPQATSPLPAQPGPATGSQPALSGQTVVARSSRAEQRAARRRASQRRQLTLIVAAVTVVAVAAGAWLVAGLRGGDGAGNSRPPSSARQETLLVQVAGDDGVAQASALFGVQGREAASVLIPSRLIVDVAGSGTVPFGETLALPQRSAPADALTDLLGIRVGGSWVLTRDALARLVDRVGGVQADVDVDVVTKDAAGRERVAVRSGPQKLDGRAAATYATYAADAEPEQARLARFDEVIGAVLRALPDEPAKVAADLGAAGSGSESTLADDRLAATLADVHAAAAADTLVSDVLPVREIDTGTTEQAYGVDTGRAGELIRSRFAGSLQQDASGSAVRVLVENGVGTPGLVEKARTRLVDAGFRFVNGGNAAEFGYDTSAVLIPDSTDENQQRGEDVAKALGLPDASIEISGRGQTVAEVIVILGEDFRP